MRKVWKILLITVLSLFAVLIITISIASWLVFTPERLTPIVRNQAAKVFTCQSEIGEVDLTFFSTYPNLGLKIRKFVLVNPVNEAPSDTLVKVEELIGIVDSKAWRKKKELVLVGLELTGGSINAFSDSLGNTNFDIFVENTKSKPESDPDEPLPVMDIREVKLDDVNLKYLDLSAKINAVIKNLSAEMNGRFTGDNVNANLLMTTPGISFDYDGESYLDGASLQLELPVDIVLSRQLIHFKQAAATINDLAIRLNGSVENDTLNRQMITDLDYRFSSWPISSILAMVPPSLQKNLEAIDVDGYLTSEGTIKGNMNDSIMPLMDIHLVMEEGKMKYEEFPLPLHDLQGDINLYSDLKTDELSYVRINRFHARTPKSRVTVEGLVNHLFTDISCDLTTSSRIKLDEFAPMIPDSLNLVLAGNAAGKIRSSFSLAALKKMQLEKMKFSGSMTLSDFDAVYDSLSLRTNRSKIDFTLPNRNGSGQNTNFVAATVLADYLSAGKLESYHASLQNGAIKLETSDIRDTTRIPDLLFSFALDAISAEMDTMSLEIIQPDGKLSISPRAGAPDQPRIRVAYSGDRLTTRLGENTVLVNKINLDTDILNDNTQKDIFLQWLARGLVDFDEGTITLSGFPHPIEIPSIQMNFEPEFFRIDEASLIIDKSDFELTGELINILSYFRGDSLLRGEFSFVSDTTDIEKILLLTNGMGNKDTIKDEQREAADSNSVYKGPYMVPEGIDVLLNTDIKIATFGIDTATNIMGNVHVSDGILLLDELSFETPAARMQLTSMYRTPRKNHLYLGLDYHMLDVEIGELLNMIPDIDSLMPMLRSFEGEGEFHIAVETYLDSLYNLKKSTLRGASSIKGDDLVLMDGETFSEIAKKLKFSKKTENKVDFLSTEFTIFRNEIDIYPFLIVMDKYQAVVSGRHNFDLSFDYHVSIVDSPLPIKLGVDIKGNMDDIDVNLAKCKYAEYFRPTARKEVERKKLELRKLIREALTRKVKEKEPESETESETETKTKTETEL